MNMIENELARESRHDEVMDRALDLRREINQEADARGIHPFSLIMQARLAQAPESALKQLEIKEKYMIRDGIVSDIHGLDDPEFQKLRDTLLTQRFDRIFFLGDIGGSPKLAKLQKLFYESFYNKYKQLAKEGAADEEILSSLRLGYTDLIRYERSLASFEKKPEEELNEEISQISDEEMLKGMKRRGSYGHYGHYVSDQSEEMIAYLSADVEHYYERFASLVAEIRLNTGTKVYLMEGNWDARLPMDFEKGTQKPEPLPPDQRRFQARRFFKDHGIPYFTNIGFIENEESLVVMVPFDTVVKSVGEEDSLVTPQKLEQYKERVESARKSDKTVIMMAHAVPAWEKHGKLATGEGEVTQRNLQALMTELTPDELVYGHEHFIRKNQDGEQIDVNSKYIARYDDGTFQIGSDLSIEEIVNTESAATVNTHLPIPKEPFLGYASMDIPRWPVRNRRPRGAGGKREPVRVGRKIVPLRRISPTLPEKEILRPISS
jgi:predicted phosphodiesterase